jgi:ribosomal protein L13E
VTGFDQSSIKSDFLECARHEDRPYPVPEIASGKSFAAWLVKQVGRGDSVGDLAAAAIHNPPSGNRVRSLDGQMRHRNASPEAFEALKKAVREWITTPDGWDAFMEAEAIMSRVKNNDAAQDA